jgi:hypothetical protein
MIRILKVTEHAKRHKTLSWGNGPLNLLREGWTFVDVPNFADSRCS